MHITYMYATRVAMVEFRITNFFNVALGLTPGQKRARQEQEIEGTDSLADSVLSPLPLFCVSMGNTAH